MFFLSTTNYVVSQGATWVDVADFNLDGKLGLVITCQAANTVSVLLEKGGVFNDAVDYAVGSTPYGVVVGDFDNDK